MDRYVIMPNHIHIIFVICNSEGGRQIAPPTISTVIGQMKRSVSKTIGECIWQRSFHDHVIRDHKDYEKIANYISDNPMKWEEDCFFAEGEALILSDL